MISELLNSNAMPDFSSILSLPRLHSPLSPPHYLACYVWEDSGPEDQVDFNISSPNRDPCVVIRQ